MRALPLVRRFALLAVTLFAVACCTRTGGTVAPGGPSCVRAAGCCRAIEPVAKQGSCAMYGNMLEETCARMLPGLERDATRMGRVCEP